MLEVKNLTKVYKSKEGAAVLALNDVSLQFPEKGMVFLLGKSGSGKSTLLNVCGGLDAPTEGEIIVKGRSSNNFSKSDFDSYRNTYIGFVFQEYNILNEFSVEDNIALALELQGKSKDKAVIDKLLEDVDLGDYGKRKPNTLSGGQKQRVAIARALVKNPEIIMADEPTGALDSGTGRQVLETLKKLSRDKLVIVVSHDRDFAERYADRIIELKDGAIISDVTKTRVENQSVSENVQALGDVLCIKNGDSLTDKDFESIKSFLKKSSSDIIIANGEKDVKKFKKLSHISEDGEKEVFKETNADDVNVKAYSEGDAKFITSKLPLKHAIKIGLSGMKSKPFRLTLTVLLCTVAFVLFGLLSTLSFYDSEATFKESIESSTNTLMRVKKQYKSSVDWYYNGELEHSYESNNDTRFTENELNEYKKSFGKDAFGGVATYTMLNVRTQGSDYWYPNISSFAYLPEGNVYRNDINGNYPKNDDEIVLSSYIADVFVACKVHDANGNEINLSARDDLIGKKINVGGRDYKVTGIMNVGEIPQEYEVLKTSTDENERLLSDFYTLLQDGLHLVAFVTQDHLKDLSGELTLYGEDDSYFRQVSIALPDKKDNVKLPDWTSTSYISYSNFTNNYDYIAISENKAPKEDEVIVPSCVLYELAMDVIARESERTGTYSSDMEKIQRTVDELYAGGIWSDGSASEEPELDEFTEEEKKEKTEDLIKLLEDNNYKLELNAQFFSSDDQKPYGETYAYKIIGIYMAERNDATLNKVVLNDKTEKKLWDAQKVNHIDYSEVTTNYVKPKSIIYDNIFLPYDHSEEQTELYWQMYQNEEYEKDDSLILLTGDFVNNLKYVDQMIDELSQAFLYIGLVMAVFAALLFSNFISASISQKKRDIGILRAVGARSSDVFKIFFAESLFISIVCMVLSTIGCLVASHFINQVLSEGIGAAIIVFGVASFLVLILVALVTCVVSTFIPVKNAASKKPVDSIRAI